tara:strand:- start:19104 stop:21266 length:2163 start_codon:yes stop_codon:yes gene_type:complete
MEGVSAVVAAPAAPPDTKSFKAAFQSVANWFERPSSDTVLFSGFPEESLTGDSPDDVERLASRIGLDVETLSLKACRSGQFETPVILVFSDGSSQAFLDRNDAGELICAPNGAGGDTKPVQLTEIADQGLSHGFAFRKHYANHDEAMSVGEAPRIERRHWLVSCLLPFWRNYIRVGVAALFINIIALASPLFVMNVYDRVLPNHAFSTLWVLTAGIALAMIFDFLLKTARAELIDHAGRQADLRLSHVLFDKVLHTSLSHRPLSTGEYASRVMQYEYVREFFTSNTIAVLIDSLFVFIFLAVIYLIGGWLVIFPAAALVICLLIGYIAQARIGKRVATAANESARRQALLVESISTIETLKSMRAEPIMLRRWRELSLNASLTSEKIKQISSNASLATNFVQQATRILVIFGGAYAFAEGEMPMGAIIAVVMLAGIAGAPMGQIAMTLSRLRQALLSLRTLDSIMELEEDRPSTTGFVNRQVTRGSFAFENVSFAYPGSDHAVVEGFNLSVAPGERVGIIGRIGSGKTTIGRLLGGLYMPAEGRLKIDGVDSRQYHVAEIRSAVSIAGQSSDLFSGTVKENLVLGRSDVTDEELLEVCERTGVDQIIGAHPRGFDMPVGERGNNLSTGQKQALTITRLLLSQPKIVFLDEPSGAMDLASEQQLIKCLRGAFPPETTLVMATHRHSMLELVDRLVVMDKGRVVADGPKNDVIAAMRQGGKS